MMRAGLYLRVSTEDQGKKGYSLPSQLSALRALAARLGFETDAETEFVDDGDSGATLDRPALTRLLDAVRRKDVGAVLVFDLDRLARDLRLSLTLEYEFKKAGAQVHYSNLPSEQTPEANLQRQMLGAFAELERHKIRERTLRGKKEKAKRGLVPARVMPYGYRRDWTEKGIGGFRIEDEEAKVVRWIFDWLADGRSLRQVVDRLNARGIKPPRGSRWSRSSVARIVRSTTYTGRALYNQHGRSVEGKRTLRDASEWVAVPVPAIISQSTFSRAERARAKHRNTLSGRPSARTYLLRGLLVCGACGRRMHGNGKGKENRRTYRCEARDRLIAGASENGERCRSVVRDASRLEARIKDLITRVLDDPEALAMQAKAHRHAFDTRQVRARDVARELREQLTKTDRAIEKLNDAYFSTSDAVVIPKAEWLKRTADLKAKRETLAKELGDAEAEARLAQASGARREALVRKVALLRKGLHRLDDAGWMLLLRDAVDRIEVSGKKGGNIKVFGALSLTPNDPHPTPPHTDRNCIESPRSRPASLSGHTPRLSRRGPTSPQRARPP